jgi:hypothetical protein
LDAPKEFIDRLKNTFYGELRVRWSIRDHMWLIEQKVGRAALPTRRIREIDDELIQLKDGYARVMAVARGSVVPCSMKCGADLKLKIRETVEVVCDRCKLKGKKNGFIGGYFPLDDQLIEHLKMMDPTRSDQLRRVRAETEYANWLKKVQEESVHREAAAQYKDALLDQLPKAGFPSLTPDKWYH